MTLHAQMNSTEFTYIAKTERGPFLKARRCIENTGNQIIMAPVSSCHARCTVHRGHLSGAGRKGTWAFVFDWYSRWGPFYWRFDFFLISNHARTYQSSVPVAHLAISELPACVQNVLFALFQVWDSDCTA